MNENHDNRMLTMRTVIILSFVVLLISILPNNDTSVKSSTNDITNHNNNQEVQLDTIEIQESVPLANQPTYQHFQSIIKETESYVELTDNEIYSIAQIVYLEGRGESKECQQAIISVIVNRIKYENKTAEEVIFADNQFSTASYIEKGDPDDDIIALVKDVAENGPTIPNYVTYFRANTFHEWKSDNGEVVPYINIDNTYFSFDIKIFEQLSTI